MKILPWISLLRILSTSSRVSQNNIQSLSNHTPHLLDRQLHRPLPRDKNHPANISNSLHSIPSSSLTLHQIPLCHCSTESSWECVADTRPVILHYVSYVRKFGVLKSEVCGSSVREDDVVRAEEFTDSLPEVGLCHCLIFCPCFCGRGWSWEGERWDFGNFRNIQRVG